MGIDEGRPGGSSGGNQRRGVERSGSWSHGKHGARRRRERCKGRGRIVGGLASAAAAGVRQMDDYEGARDLSAAVTAGSKVCVFACRFVYATNNRATPGGCQTHRSGRNRQRTRNCPGGCEPCAVSSQGLNDTTPPAQAPTVSLLPLPDAMPPWHPSLRISPHDRLRTDAAIACPCRVADSQLMGQGITSFAQVEHGAWTPVQALFRRAAPDGARR